MGHQGEVPPIAFREVSKETDTARFCCGERSVDHFIRKDAHKAHSLKRQRVTCAALSGSPYIAGFMSLACVTEKVRNLPATFHPFGGDETYPCVQIVWLGVDKAMQGRKIGSRLVGAAIDKFAKIGQEVGIPHLILVPISNAVKAFYGDLGFMEYHNGERMFLPLQAAIEANREP